MKRDIGFDAAIAFARDLIRIPGLPGREGDVADRVRVEFERLGFDDVWVDDLGSVLGRIIGRGDAPPVLLSCHLDCVDVGAADAWRHKPFDADIADGALHGRGAMDIKGPLAIQSYAAAHFVTDRPRGDIVLAHTVLEERGGWGMSHVMGTIGEDFGAAIIGESTNGDICIGHRGRAELIIEIHGTAGHASAPERALNPTTPLARMIPAIEAYARTLPAHDLLGRSTMAVTAIETLPHSRNVIPDLVRLVLDWRVLPGSDGDELAAALLSHLESSLGSIAPFRFTVSVNVERQSTYTGTSADRPLFTPGFLLDSRHPVVSAAVDTIAARTGQRPNARPWTFATDGGYTCGVYGVPTIGYAPGEERHAHTNVERLDLAAARTAFDAYPALIDAVQAAARA